ncbi:MAG: hypothetical protein R3B59_06725 [Dehalococcoidia bacterium]
MTIGDDSDANSQDGDRNNAWVFADTSAAVAGFGGDNNTAWARDDGCLASAVGASNQLVQCP